MNPSTPEGILLAEAALREWCRLYGHRDNPAWVVYDLMVLDRIP